MEIPFAVTLFYGRVKATIVNVISGQVQHTVVQAHKKRNPNIDVGLSVRLCESVC